MNRFYVAGSSCLVGLLLCVGTALNGCGSSGSDPLPGTLNLMVGDAATDTISSFEVAITGAYLVNPDNLETFNLLESVVTVDLLNLSTQSVLLQIRPAPSGLFDAARIVFDPASIVARDLSGAPIPVAVTTTNGIGLFSDLIDIALGNSSVHFDVDLDESLEDDPMTPGGLLFTPVVHVEKLAGQNAPLDEIFGRIRGFNAPFSQLEVELLDRETGASRGTLPLLLNPRTALFGNNALPFADLVAFFAAVAGGDRLEAQGVLRGDGKFLADLAKVERNSVDVGRIRGTISDLDLGSNLLTLRIREIDTGRLVIQPVLTGLGDPAEIQVDLSVAAIVVERPIPQAGSPSDLAIGQNIKVKFSTFANAPFPARRIEVDDKRPQFQGTIVDSSGLPNSVIMHLESTDPAVTSGRVDSDTTNVVVTLDGSEPIWLKVEGFPMLTSPSLFDNLEVRVKGMLTGPSSAPNVDAEDLRVRPGELNGEVQSTDRSTRTFVATAFQVDKPFGGGALPDPVSAQLASSVEWDGDVSSEQGFFDAFVNLQAGEVLEVEVYGIADGQGGVIAHEVKATVR